MADKSCSLLKNHPEYLKLLQDGCSEEKARNAFLVYLDLSEVKKWWDLKLVYNKTPDAAYVLGKSQHMGLMKVIVPLPSETELSCQIIRKYIFDFQEVTGLSGVTLAVCSSDSTILYYDMSDGLVPPESPEKALLKAQKHEMLYDLNRKKRKLSYTFKVGPETVKPPVITISDSDDSDVQIIEN